MLKFKMTCIGLGVDKHSWQRKYSRMVLRCDTGAASLLSKSVRNTHNRTHAVFTDVVGVVCAALLLHHWTALDMGRCVVLRCYIGRI